MPYSKHRDHHEACNGIQNTRFTKIQVIVTKCDDTMTIQCKYSIVAHRHEIIDNEKIINRTKSSRR